MIETGSVWRKWDLHVHLPDTRLNNRYKKKSPAMNEVDWDRFCAAIESSDVDVIGLTDYFSISSFKTCVDRFRRLYPKSQKFFIPNMELRTLDVLSDEHVNLHLLFNPEMDQTDFDAFCSDVQVTMAGGNRQRLSTIQKCQTSYKWESITVGFDEVIDALDRAFASDGRNRRDSVIVVVSGRKDGLAHGDKATPRAKARAGSYGNRVDAIFGSSRDREYWLVGDKEAVDFTPRPTFRGCDGHSFESLAEKLGKSLDRPGNKSEINWVKADPTWQGLLQTLIEPESRVWIGESPFDFSRESRKTIGELKFSSESNFPSRIVLNPGLNSIIGSRSSGKSALLTHIAQVVIPDFAERQKNEYSIQVPGPASGYAWADCAEDVPQVLWASGAEEGNVVYVPQGYLSEIGENHHDINQLIVDFLADKCVGKKIAYEEHEEVIQNYAKAAKTRVSQMGEIWRRMISFQQEQSEISPSRQALETAEEDIDNKIQEKTSMAGADGSRLEQALKAKERADNLNMKLSSFADDIFVNSHPEFQYPEPERCFFLSKDWCEPIITLSDEEVELLSSCKKRIESLIMKELETLIQEISARRTGAYHELEKEHSEKQEELASFDDLLKSAAALKTLLPQKKEIQESLRQWDVLQEGIETQRQTLDKHNEGLRAEAAVLIERNQEFVEKFAVALEEFADITIQAELFEEPGYLEEILRPVHRRDSKAWFDSRCVLSFEERVKEFEKIFIEVMSGKVSMKSNHDPLALLRDYAAASPKLALVANFDGDQIGGSKETTMSPGKRALFALTMLLSRVGSGWPLLLDQPEDDLDSRSIYETIVPFLLEQKKKRQIIMVSHNANLVVGADSELVLIANRDSSEQQNPDRRTFDFLGGSLESAKARTGQPSYLEEKSVSEHVVELLDGGAEAFRRRENKYAITGVGIL